MKFKHGDWVQIADDLGESMAHFTSGCEAIVIGSYADQFGGTDTDSYTLFIKEKGGTSSWYKGHQLTLIKGGQEAKLAEWKKEADEDQGTNEVSDKVDPKGIRPEHHYIVKQAQGPLCALLKLFLGGRLKASYPTIIGVASLKVHEKAVPHPNHPKIRFPLSTLIQQDPKAQALYENLVANSVEPPIARSILPMGVVVQMEVGGLESDWEALRMECQNSWCWSVTTMTEIEK